MRRRLLLPVVVAVALAGLVMTTSRSAFLDTTDNPGSSFVAASNFDTTAPTISRVVTAKTSGGTAGTIRQGGDYYVYAQVTDDVSVASVTVDVSSFDGGVTAASLSTTGGPWTVGGNSYSHRTAVLTADSPLNTGSTYPYTVSATDGAGNAATPFSASATIETYDNVINNTSGRLGYWRLGDGAISADELDDAPGTVLSSHTGSVAASWTSSPGQARTALITDQNRVRKETGDGAALYYTSATPSSANYLVEADVHVKSLLATDAAGVVGRLSTTSTSDTFYFARYVVDQGYWQLMRVVNGSAASLGTYSQTLNGGQTYRLTLEMNGSTIRLLVDGVQRISASDTNITEAGRGGIRLGVSNSTAQVTNTAGLHLDDFRITSLTTTALDSAGTNNGTCFGGVRLNQPGALVGNSNRGFLFDGSNDYVNVARQISDDFSIEFWFKSTQGIGTGNHWWSGAGLVDAEVGGSTNDFGVSLRADGRVLAGVGNPDTSIQSSTGGFNDGGWHHVVFTRTRSTGALTLYVDGQSEGSATGPTQALTAASNISFGRIQTGSFYYAGSLDEVAVYTTALDSATVLDHYRAGTGTG